MGLFQKAMETYDNMSHLVGVEVEGKATLAPIGFISTKASIEITLTSDGKFVSASKTEEKIIIPATEESMSRTSAPAPHMLSDQYGYLTSLINPQKFEIYISALKDWLDFDQNNEFVRAVYNYIINDSINDDLILNNCEAKEKDIICWRVLIEDGETASWKNTKFFKSSIAYYENQISERDSELCYITGEMTTPAMTHLKGAVPLAGNAKLISANDVTNFTFKGRFLTSEEAVSIGYEASQKAHNALKWLVENEGVYKGNRLFLCWNPKGKKLPKPMFSLYSFEEDENLTPSQYKENLYKIVNSYKNTFKPDDEAVIATFEAANTGRLATTYYNEICAQDFVENLAFWDETCCFSNNKGVSVPSLMRIIDISYGILKKNTNGNFDYFEADEKIVPQLMQIVFSCRISKKPLPTIFMRGAIEKCEHLMLYTNSLQNKTLLTTCALIKKYKKDYLKEDCKMALEPDKKNRSYQFGRLLAVLEKIEKDTYSKDEDRVTNAIRMQSIYCNRPAYAAKVIDEQIKRGYWQRLSVGQRTFYDKIIGEIYAILSEFSEDLNKPLTEDYILGYYLQKNDLYTKKEIKTTEENENV